jgi:glycine/D-amino acid oxidase-like deaminating enzyme
MAIDLQSGKSYWLLKNPELPVFPPLEKNERADVVIIGGGVTGALAASLVAEAGFDVVVLDRRRLACGSTGASTALLSYEPDTSFAELAAMRGRDAALRSYRAARRANQEIGELIARLGFQCGYEKVSSIYLARSKEQAVELDEEYRDRNEGGFPCEYLSRQQLAAQFGLVGEAAIVSPDAGQVDPVLLTVGLLRYVTQRGSRCYHAHVAQFEKTPDGYIVTTAEGRTIAANRIVIATGYETQQRLQQSTVRLASTYAIATSVIDDLPASLRKSILWDLDEPYHYVRSTADSRLLVGGEDDPFLDEEKRDARMHAKAEKLLSYQQEILPQLGGELYCEWCGTFGVSEDGLPYVGERSGADGAYHVLAYGGNGITFAMVAARCLIDALQDRINDDAQLFSFERDGSVKD